MKPVYFLYENVASMKDKDRDIITSVLGVNPFEVCSSLFSAQTRKRYYWTNIPQSPLPVHCDVKFRDILQTDGYTLLSDKAIQYMNRKTKNGLSRWSFGYIHNADKPKSQTLIANIRKGVPYNVCIDGDKLRHLTVVECERLQTVPEGYTKSVNKTAAYEMLGNGWNINTIAHLLSNIAITG